MIKLFFLLLLLSLNISCSKDVVKKSVISKKSLDLQVLEAYEEGMKSLESGDVLFAAKKFNEAEILFPQSDWAPKSALMAAYAYYYDDYNNRAISELTNFFKKYPKVIPGSTIVVPEKIERESKVLSQITQITTITSSIASLLAIVKLLE